MSELFNSFKHLLVVSKLLGILEQGLDIRDKVLAEFVLDLAKQS